MAVVAVALAATGLAAQEPQDTAARPAAADTVPVDTVAADTGAARVPPPEPRTAPRFSFTVFVGTLDAGDLQEQPVQIGRVAEDGTVSAADTLQRTVGVGGGLQVGASAVWSLSPTWALRVGAAWGSGSLEAGYGGGTEDLRDEVGSLAVAGSDVSVVQVESAIRYRIPSAYRLRPYAELGAGAVRWSVQDESFPGAAGVADVPTRWAVLAGVGGTLQLRPGLSAGVAVTGRFYRTPFSTAAEGAPVGEGDSLVVTFAAPAARPFADSRIELARVLRLEAGITLELGRVEERPRDRSAPAGSPNAPPR